MGDRAGLDSGRGRVQGVHVRAQALCGAPTAGVVRSSLRAVLVPALLSLSLAWASTAGATQPAGLSQSPLAAVGGELTPGTVVPGSALGGTSLSTGPVAASTAQLGYSLKPSSTEPSVVCPPPAPGKAGCLSVIDPKPVKTASGFKASDAGPLLEGGGEKQGWAPKELQEAYKIPTTGGSTQTVAIVDAYDDPNAEADLQTYRSKYKVYYRSGETACTKANGCFKKVNQEGKEEKYPTDKYPIVGLGGRVEDWGLEISLDLDMVSAACPECKIVLVEANNNEAASLYAAEGESVVLEAGGEKLVTEVSNSWGTREYSEEASDDTHFDHPNVPTTVSAGDSGYGVSYPAASKYVISVGGTTLKKKAESERGWEETVWKGTGSGCSAYESKPAWQGDAGCSKRTDNDVAAVANNESPVSMYDSYEYNNEEGKTGELGWVLVGGTSVSAPLVAGIEAHASSAVKDEGAEAFYRHTLFNVTSGSNGGCGNTYLCEAGAGYNGPTGWGTPDGPLELTPKTSAITEAATEMTASGATLHGYVYTTGLETTYHFEYGPTTSYGTSVPVPSGSVPSGVGWQAVSQSVTGLRGFQETYHYRIVATNSSGTVYGADRSFTKVPWAIQKIENPTGSAESYLESVSCASAASCFAVASYWDEPLETRWALIEAWNGTQWTQQSAAKPTGAKYSLLKGVSCESSTECAAVGYYLNSSNAKVSLAERWNGTQWSVESVPSSVTLDSVSCVSPVSCIAVGADETVEVSEGWNGKEWSTLTGGGGQAVSCKFSKFSPFCMAVGGDVNSVFTAKRWNGTTWSVETLPVPAGAVYSQLEGVSCPSTVSCTAVGFYLKSESNRIALAERWNGQEWSIQSTSSPGEESVLNGVACPSPVECHAVGRTRTGIAETTLSEGWNNTEWTVESTPWPEESTGFEYAFLSGVACISKDCTAVGRHTGLTAGLLSLNNAVPLAEQRAIVAPSTETKQATSVAELSATLDGAVNPESWETKYYFEYGTTTAYGSRTAEVNVGSGTSSLEEAAAVTGLKASTAYHYRIVATSPSGTSSGADKTFTTSGPWQLVSTPNPKESQESELKATSCLSSAVCMAVGYYDHEKGFAKPVAFAEERNSGEWSVQSVTLPEGGHNSVLAGVSCTSSTSCVAVGHYLNTGGTEQTLAEEWNGSGWKPVSTPNPVSGKSPELSAVSCASTSMCYAVGRYFNSASEETGLVERWNGTEWSIQSIQQTAEMKKTDLFGVSCPSTGLCNAIGDYQNSAGENLPLAEGWTSESNEWKSQSAVKPKLAKETVLEAVSCVSTSECVATGHYVSGAGELLSLAELWTGTGWSTRSTPNLEGGVDDFLDAVSCSATNTCVATGYAWTSTWVPLAEERESGSWKIRSTSNPTGAKRSFLQGVSCATSSTCLAVGYYESSSGEIETLAEEN